MSCWRRTAAQIGLKVPRLTAHAMDYLEARGLKFCIDYGTVNAVQKANDLWLQEMEKQIAERT